MKYIFLIPVFIFVLSSCGQIEEMRENAKEASDNSGRAAAAAEESREEIANSRILTRSSKASASRRDALHALLKAQSFEMKATEAAKFMKALEYQLWTQQKYDSPDYLDKLYEDSMKELFRSLVEINENAPLHGSELSPFVFSDSERNKNLGVYAMAAALHIVHNYMDLLVTEKKVLNEVLSPLDLISQTFVKIQKFEKSEIAYEEFKPHEKVIYRYHDEAVALLQARLNILLVIALKRSTSVLKSTTSVFILRNTGFSPLDSETLFASKNKAEQIYVLRALSYAKDTYELLLSQKIEPVLDEDLKDLYQTVTTSSLKSTSSDKEAPSLSTDQSYTDYLDYLNFFFGI